MSRANEQRLREASKTHTVYRTSDGRRVPGASTISGLIGKEALIDWAWRLGTEGIDYRTYRDATAVIGTIAHALIHQYVGGPEVDLGVYPPLQVEMAQDVFETVKEQFFGPLQRVELVMAEEPLVSDRYLYGGTMDMVAWLDDKLVLLDWKTSKGLYPNHLIQLAGYLRLLIDEADVKPDACMLVNIPRDRDSSVRVVTKSTDWMLDVVWPVFEHLLGVYYGLKKVKL